MVQDQEVFISLFEVRAMHMVECAPHTWSGVIMWHHLDGDTSRQPGGVSMRVARDSSHAI